jgi:8-oxo-dGTP diphosphatase
MDAGPASGVRRRLVPMEPIRVVAAVIQRDGKILACRRAPHKSLAGLWEFPGGKVEPGETDEVALAREIREELSIEITVGEFIAESVAPAGEAMILLNAYWAQTNVAGEVSSTDHDRMEWLAPADLETVTWAPADVPFLALVLKLPSA